MKKETHVVRYGRGENTTNTCFCSIQVPPHTGKSHFVWNEKRIHFTLCIRLYSLKKYIYKKFEQTNRCAMENDRRLCLNV